MKRNNRVTPGSVNVVDQTLAAMELMNCYCQAHPGGPAAVRRPQLLFRSGVWVALLGPSVEEGIVGIGSTVETALRAFDDQYLAALRPPEKRIIQRRAASKASSYPQVHT